MVCNLTALAILAVTAAQLFFYGLLALFGLSAFLNRQFCFDNSSMKLPSIAIYDLSNIQNHSQHRILLSGLFDIRLRRSRKLGFFLVNNAQFNIFLTLIPFYI